MPYLRRTESSVEGVDLYYEDHGAGPAVVLIHGWPLDSSCWEKQVPVLLEAGYRVVYYDRRGFGGSSRPAGGYDYDTLATDLVAVLDALKLQDVALIGFSMGTGECARYLGRYGSSRVRAVAFLACLPPFLAKSFDNPEGMGGEWFDEIVEAIARDRYAFATGFFRGYYGADQLGRERVSDELLVAASNQVALVSATTLIGCVRSWKTDFRTDLQRIGVPALVLHGDDDRLYPIASTGLLLHRYLEKSNWVVIEGGPHGLLWTHAAAVNRELLAFLRRSMTDSVI